MWKYYCFDRDCDRGIVGNIYLGWFVFIEFLIIVNYEMFIYNIIFFM